MQHFAQTLQHLHIQHSDLADVHTQGLAACTALTQLVMINVNMFDNNGMEYLDSDMSLVPPNMQMLTQLHTLDIGTGSSRNDVSNLAWVFSLISLQDLSMQFLLGRSDMLQHASALTKLTRFTICGDDIRGPQTTEYGVDIEWDRLQALQVLSLRAFTLRLGSGVAGLLQLQNLRRISFIGILLPRYSDTACFAALTYKLARQRPHVKVHVRSGTDVVDYFN